MPLEVWIVFGISVALWLGYHFIRYFLLRRGLWPSEQRRIQERTARYARDVLGRCPACSAALNGHLFCEPICLPHLGKADASSITDSILNHDWESLKGKHYYQPDADALVYWFVQCPHTRRGIVYQVNSKAGFDENDSVEFIELLDEDATAEFARIVCPQAPLFRVL
jgi:hypothetical protein